MIYTKPTNFSYPILNNLQDDYLDKNFYIDIKTDYKDGRNYQFKINVDLASEFLLNEIKENRAKILLIISSVDSRYYEVNLDDPVVKVADNRVYLKNNTKFQSIIMSTDNINFKDNNDLHPFYDEFKSDINVGPGKLLAFSNYYTFSGNLEEAVEIFKQTIDPDLSVPIDIRLDSNFITLVFKDSNIGFKNSQDSRDLKNMYLYAGLQKALLNLISKNLNMNRGYSLEDGIAVERINNGNALDMKLKKLLQDKGIEYIYLENIDEVVQKIAEGIVNKYVEAVRSNYEWNLPFKRSYSKWIGFL